METEAGEAGGARAAGAAASWSDRLRAAARRVAEEIAYYRRLLAHPRTPRRAKVLLWLAVAYFALPIDLIPDFIPVLGHLDDALIIPLLVILALRSIPADVAAECR